MKDKRIIICGHSGSGKDYLLKGLIKKGFEYRPKSTTRPMRKGEKNGIEYTYYKNVDFYNMLNEDKILYYQTFIINDDKWIYFMTKEDFNNSELFIMTPYEISNIEKIDRESSFIIFIDIPEDIRYKRILERNDSSDKVARRIESDREDFNNFSDYDLRLCDSVFNINDVYSLINN